MKYTVRIAHPNDCARLAALVGELGYSGREDLLRRKLSEFALPGNQVLVADYNGEAVGLLCFSEIPLFHIDGMLGRISALVVDSRFQAHGIGKRMVTEAERFAWGRDCARIEITSGDHRPEAHAFYQAIGYKQDSRRFIKPRPAPSLS